MIARSSTRGWDQGAVVYSLVQSLPDRDGCYLSRRCAGRGAIFFLEFDFLEFAGDWGNVIMGLTPHAIAMSPAFSWGSRPMLLQCRPLSHGAHAPCYCNVARFLMGLTPHAIAMSHAPRAPGEIVSFSWGSRPMLLQCRTLCGLRKYRRRLKARRSSASSLENAPPGAFARGYQHRVGLQSFARHPTMPGPDSGRFSLAQKPPPPLSYGQAKTQVAVPSVRAREAVGIAIAWRRQPQVRGSITPGPIFSIQPAREAGGIVLAWRRQPQVCGSITPGPIFSIHPAREAGGIVLAWRRQPQVRGSITPGPIFGIHPAREAGDITLAWRRQPQVRGSITPGPIFGIHPARKAGGITLAWPVSPRFAAASRPDRFSASTQPAKRATFH